MQLSIQPYKCAVVEATNGYESIVFVLLMCCSMLLHLQEVACVICGHLYMTLTGKDLENVSTLL